MTDTFGYIRVRERYDRDAVNDEKHLQHKFLKSQRNSVQNTEQTVQGWKNS